MPMMIDDIDDLFTDTLNVPPPSPIPGLLERVEELRLSGCCQYVSRIHIYIHISKLFELHSKLI
jgi:hypothetical protein